MRVRRDSTEAQRRASRAACASRWAKTFEARAAKRAAILAHVRVSGNKSATGRAFNVDPSYVYQILKASAGLAPVDERGERETG